MKQLILDSGAIAENRNVIENTSINSVYVPKIRAT